ncbi:MAG: quinone-dependent dihydroorotate dehydrogenase [Gammaproteobacteria bacterium]|nr:quinone-dependent dihydroorotate dehydrogenase [Gammaproteobacteria bacterium]
MWSKLYPLLRQSLFCLPAETSHHLAIDAFAALGALPFNGGVSKGARAVQLMGLTFPNRVGLAAGLDKDARAAEGLAALGFGHVEVGTVTPLPQPGNPQPRLFRIPPAGAMVNRMGFNSEGLSAMVRRLEGIRSRNRLRDTLLGVNLGKNKDTPVQEAHRDYVRGLEAVYPYADYVTLNLSSPNTPGLRTLQSPEALRELLTAVLDARERVGRGRTKPVVVKIAPDLVAEDLDAIAAVVSTLRIDGIIATNTTITRPGVDECWQQEAGGLSGPPLLPLSLATVRGIRERLGPSVPIIGVGGISSSDDARAMFAAGADLVQVYTGFIYRGPILVHELARV